MGALSAFDFRPVGKSDLARVCPLPAVNMRFLICGVGALPFDRRLLTVGVRAFARMRALPAFNEEFLTVKFRGFSWMRALSACDFRLSISGLAGMSALSAFNLMRRPCSRIGSVACRRCECDRRREEREKRDEVSGAHECSGNASLRWEVKGCGNS